MGRGKQHLKIIHSVPDLLFHERAADKGLVIVRALCEATDDATWAAAFQELLRFETTPNLSLVTPTIGTASEEACHGSR